MNSEITRQCHECNGKGEVPLIGYRDMAQSNTESTKPVKIFRERWNAFKNGAIWTCKTVMPGLLRFRW